MSATLSTTRSFEPPLSLLAEPGTWFAVTMDFERNTLLGGIVDDARRERLRLRLC
nr:ORF IIB satellite RNa5 [Cucumber mosaic virus]